MLLFHFIRPLAAADGEQLEKQFEKLAESTTHFSTRMCAWNSPIHYITGYEKDLALEKLVQEQMDLMEALKKCSSDRPQLEGLLKHPDPKVRTLALGAIFQREDGRDLPLIVALEEDDAPTFPNLSSTLRAGGRPETISDLESDQSVGEVAARLLDFWGVPHAKKKYGGANERDFAKYWEERKDREYCTGWFHFKLSRASRGISSTRKAYLEDIRNVRKQIDQLPKEDRAWVLISLRGRAGHDALTSEDELVKMLQEIPPDRLLLILQRKASFSDPDLQQPGVNNSLTAFILKHAGSLLRPQDADVLLACEEDDVQKIRFHSLPTEYWVTAAASLRSVTVSQMLREALENAPKQDEFHAKKRARFVVAFLKSKIADDSDISYLTDWFYGEFPTKEPWDNWRAQFFNNIPGDKGSSGRNLVFSILLDNRFEQLEWDLASLKELASELSIWEGQHKNYQQDIGNIKKDQTLRLKHEFQASLRERARQLFIRKKP